VLVLINSLAAQLTVPGRNGKIAFDREFMNGFTINPDGTQEQQIGPAGTTTCTTWSPDGGKILCNLWGDNGPQPAIADPDGLNFSILNPNLPLDLFCIFWSPDGERLLCHSEGISNLSNAGLYTVRASDAGDLVRIATTPVDGSYDISYGYSPDGSRILFARFANNGSQGKLFSVNADGSATMQLSPSNLWVIDLPFFDSVGADWSPNGARVTFAARNITNGQASSTALFVVKADGTGLHQVTPSGLGAISAQWAPDGSLIAFTSCCGIPEAWVVHPDGTGLREVTEPVEGAFSIAPVWSPDSRKLLFNRENSHGPAGLWTADVNGSHLSKLADTTDLTLYSWGTALITDL
jgi:TolB protein